MTKRNLIAAAAVTIVGLLAGCSQPGAPDPTTAPIDDIAASKPAAVTGTPYIQKDIDAWRVAKDPSRSEQERRDAYNIAATPAGIWLGGYPGDGEAVERITTEGHQNSAVPQFVLYAIPGRDCGGFATGGLADDEQYRTWIDGISAGLADRMAILVLEPDAVSFCHDDPATRERWSALMTYAAVTIHDNNPHAVMYVHAGSGRPDPTPDDMAQRLAESGVEYMRGFAMNVSGLGATADQEAYGDELVAALEAEGFPDKRYVVDTSRNGLGRTDNPGAAYNSCNNMNAALGQRPTTEVQNPRVDAYLWIKRPGESDGLCHESDTDAPNSGWYPALARNLVANAVTAGIITYWDLPASL